MKTDLERFKELYLSFGIELNHTAEPDDGEIDIKLNGWGSNARDQFDESYQGFYSLVTFDKNGKFIKQGFFE